MSATRNNFGEELKRWRRERGKTQLDVSYIAGYSQRHVSFLESGRSRPSRATVITLAEALDVPIKERNAMLNAAGYAPLYTQEPIDSARLQHAVAALDVVLQSHRPFPAIVVDRGWNTLAGNDSAFALFQTFLDSPLQMNPERPMNAMQLCVDADGLRPYILNWLEFVTALLVQLRHQLEFEGDNATLRQLVDAIESDPEFVAHSRATDITADSPTATLSLQRDGLRVDLFTLISVFGTPNDATLSELRVETFFPANETSRTVLLAIDRKLTDADPTRVGAAPLAVWRRTSQ